MNEKELSEASFKAFQSLDIVRNCLGTISRMTRDVKEYAADYENQASDMKYARMLGLYEGFVSGLEHDIEELITIVDEGYSAAEFLAGGKK